MAFVPRTWLPRLGTDLNRYLVNNQRYETLVNAPTEITQQGDMISATNLNDLETRIKNAFDDLQSGKTCVISSTSLYSYSSGSGSFTINDEGYYQFIVAGGRGGNSHAMTRIYQGDDFDCYATGGGGGSTSIYKTINGTTYDLFVSNGTNGAPCPTINGTNNLTINYADTPEVLNVIIYLNANTTFNYQIGTNATSGSIPTSGYPSATKGVKGTGRTSGTDGNASVNPSSLPSSGTGGSTTSTMTGPYYKFNTVNIPWTIPRIIINKLTLGAEL